MNFIPIVPKIKFFKALRKDLPAETLSGGAFNEGPGVGNEGVECGCCSLAEAREGGDLLDLKVGEGVDDLDLKVRERGDDLPLSLFIWERGHFLDLQVGERRDHLHLVVWEGSHILDLAVAAGGLVTSTHHTKE